MDPNETLKLVDDALLCGRRLQAAGHATDLVDWIRKGGFQPAWHKYPAAAIFFLKIDGMVPFGDDEAA